MSGGQNHAPLSGGPDGIMEPPNLSQSIRQRLLNLARQTEQDYNRILVRYSLERLLYRLSISDAADRFVLKGAMLFAVWTGHQYRATQDLDLLGLGDNSPEAMTKVFGDILRVEPEVPDAMSYLPETIKAGFIRDETKYRGVRLRLVSLLGNARIPLSIDIGFGDAVSPPPVVGQFPAMLDLPAPTLHMYCRETSIAEKLHAMVELGLVNSRMKDFADIWHLSRHFDFDGPVLAEAISQTFHRQETPLETRPTALTQEFVQQDDTQNHWRAFLARTEPEGIPQELAAVIEDLVGFLLPILEYLNEKNNLPTKWSPPGPWA
jgi:hypothetical protein